MLSVDYKSLSFSYLRAYLLIEKLLFTLSWWFYAPF